MKELVEAIAKALVDNPEGVRVNAIEGEQSTMIELSVDPSDLGKVIGRQGRTANAIRVILGAAGMTIGKRITLEMLEHSGKVSPAGRLGKKEAAFFCRSLTREF